MKPINKDSEFFPELGQLLTARRVTGRSGKAFEGLAAASTRNNLLMLRELYTFVKATRTLEIGLAFGASALLLANCHRDRGDDAHRQHIAIDPFQSTVWDDVAVEWLEKSGLREFVEIIPEHSCTALALLLTEQKRFDLVYVDGSHLFEEVFVDMYFLQPVA